MIKVLVPVVFSEFSLNALTFGITLAEKIQAEVTILHCLPAIEAKEDLPPTKEISEFGENPYQLPASRNEEQVREYLSLFIQQKTVSLTELQRKNVILNYRIEYGYPEDVIPKVCAKECSDVIIMGTKTKNETLKELLGNVTNDVIHKVKVPVLAIPSHSKIDLTRIGKVLFLTEFKEQDYFSMDRLIRIMAPFHTEIHATHFCRKKEVVADISHMEQFKLYCESTYRNHKILFRNFTGEDFVTTLDKYVVENGIDILAMTHRKRNVLQSLFNTEKTRKMLFHTDVPLLVFHS